MLVTKLLILSMIGGMLANVLVNSQINNKTFFLSKMLPHEYTVKF